MSDGTEPRSSLTLINVGLVVGGWATLTAIVAARRWLCEAPWSHQCVATFWSGVERLMLFTWVTDPEAIFAAFLAVGAAAASVWFLNRQIVQADRVEAARLRRRLRAQRAMLPLTLSNLADYATASAQEYGKLFQATHGRAVGTARIPVVVQPELSIQIAPALVDMIDAETDPAHAETIAEILSKLQVHLARWRGLRGALEQPGPLQGFTWHNFAGEICEAAEIYALAVDSLAKARPASHQLEVDLVPTTLTSALFLMGFRGGAWDVVIEMAQRQEVRRTSGK